jgi:hypothetical protein
MLVLPQSGKKLGNEELPLPYSISLFSLLSLSIVMGVAASGVISAVVLPSLPIGYTSYISANLFAIETPYGSFLLYPYWTGITAIFLVGVLIPRKGGIVKTSMSAEKTSSTIRRLQNRQTHRCKCRYPVSLWITSSAPAVLNQVFCRAW